MSSIEDKYVTEKEGFLIKVNHNRLLIDFKEDIDLLKSRGFNPIAVTQLYFEDTFVFKTKREAKLAFIEFEKNKNKGSTIVGWWYGLIDFINTVSEYEKENEGEYKVLIHWL